jgi:NAD(P)H dehydrogenase (quinone)
MRILTIFAHYSPTSFCRGIGPSLRGLPWQCRAAEKVAHAEALAIIATVYFIGFPAILKGWIERVFTLGFAFALKSEAWRGYISGRITLFTHKKALIINTTLFDQAAYESGLGAAMQTLVDDFALRYPGIQSVEYVYFYAVYGEDDSTRKACLERSYHLGKNFAR